MNPPILSYYETTQVLQEEYHLTPPLLVFEHRTLLKHLSQHLEILLCQCHLSQEEQKNILSTLNVLLLDYFEQTMLEYQLTLSYHAQQHPTPYVWLPPYQTLIEQLSRSVENIAQLSLVGHEILTKLGPSFELLLASATRKIFHEYLQAQSLQHQDTTLSTSPTS